MLHFLIFQKFDTEINQDYRSIQDKTRCNWIDVLKRMKTRRGTCDTPIITVADKEGDFYEWLHSLVTQEELFVIRTKQDRCVGNKFKKENKNYEHC